MLRILLSAFLGLAALAGSVPSSAAEYGRGYHHRYAHRHYSHEPRYYGFYSSGYPDGHVPHIGGHEYYWQHRSFPFINGAAYNYPGFYNNQTFWERVQTQANFPVQY